CARSLITTVVAYYFDYW
nr:immunoglobulin heavy chain junction region [Mus musculus]MBK4188843.1 immunoglobulin heavy chain junction region [Mus musculus]